MAPSRTRNSVKSHLECRNSYVISWQIACINFRLQLHTLALIYPKWLKRETAALNKSNRVRESTSITNTRPDSQQQRHPFSHPARQKFESSICLETDGRAVGGNFGSAPIHLVLVRVLAMSSSNRGEEGVGASRESDRFHTSKNLRVFNGGWGTRSTCTLNSLDDAGLVLKTDHNHTCICYYYK